MGRKCQKKGMYVDRCMVGFTLLYSDIHNSINQLCSNKKIYEKGTSKFLLK